MTNFDPHPILENKRILVTGGASGIGLASARLFSRLGASVFISDIADKALKAALRDTGAAGGLRGDVRVEADCRAVVAAAARACGGLDGLFHSAGVADEVSRALEIGVDVWQRIVDINLRGTFLMARSAGEHFLSHGGGSIVTMSSIQGMNGIPRRHAYGPAKAGVALLTRNLACEWGAGGVRVNALAPAYIRTPMIAELVEAGKIDVPRLEKRTPLERLGEVDEVGHAAAFLLSDLSSYITGAVLPVDGGWTAYGGPGDVATA